MVIILVLQPPWYDRLHHPWKKTALSYRILCQFLISNSRCPSPSPGSTVHLRTHLSCQIFSLYNHCQAVWTCLTSITIWVVALGHSMPDLNNLMCQIQGGLVVGLLFLRWRWSQGWFDPLKRGEFEETSVDMKLLFKNIEDIFYEQQAMISTKFGFKQHKLGCDEQWFDFNQQRCR